MPRLVPDVCPHFARGIPPDANHACDAEIVLIGEAPGEREDRFGRPFIGRAGIRLDEYLAEVGIPRSSLYVTNVVRTRPPNNNIAAVSPSDMQVSVAALHARLAKLTGPKVLVPTGNTALRAITGIQPKKKGEALITKWRGSVLQGMVAGHRTLVVPTLHPAAALREPMLDKTCILDWARIKRVATGIFKLPKRNLIVEPNAQQRQDLLAAARFGTHELSFDIETDPKQGVIICCSFSLDPQVGFSLQFMKHYAFIKEMLELPSPKVGQNFLYDAYWLAQAGIRVKGLAYDVGCIFHSQDPNAGPTSKSKDEEDPNAVKSRIKPYSLAYMTSVFTFEPYYKDAGRDEDGRFMSVGGSLTKMQQLQEYNARDAAVTLEIFRHFADNAVGSHHSISSMGTYQNYYKPLFEPILDTMLQGVRFDTKGATALRTVQQVRLKELMTEVTTEAGVPLSTFKVFKRQPKGKSLVGGSWWPEEDAKRLFGNPWVKVTGKSLSNKKLKDYLFRQIKLPKRTHKGKETVDEAALIDLRLQYPEHGQVLDRILEFRKLERQSQFLKPSLVDADGYIRCQYKQTIQTNRLSSSKNPKGSGCNLQTIPPALRQFFLPEIGHLVLELDLSQAEDRVVKVCSGHPDALELARKTPDAFDAHTEFARRLFSKVLGRDLKLADVTKKQRATGKRVRHAKNYGMRAAKLQEVMLKEDGVYLPLAECQMLLDAADAVEPWVDMYQRQVRNVVRTARQLENPYERRISFLHERIDDNLYRRAYAWVPQSTVGMLLNAQGFVPVHTYIKEQGLQSRILLQEHDALVLSVPRKEAYGVLTCAAETLMQPIMCAGHKLSIPVEVALGRTWGKEGRVEWKYLPSEEEFMAEFDKMLVDTSTPTEDENAFPELA